MVAKENIVGLVTDVFWTCPGCQSREKAQAYGDWDDPDEFPVDAVPASRGLKWNPPCRKCGKYRLVMPETMVACKPTPIDADEA
jgi:hypothetical protein